MVGVLKRFELTAEKLRPSLYEALSASRMLSLVPCGVFRDVSRMHACWTVSCDSAGM